MGSVELSGEDVRRVIETVTCLAAKARRKSRKHRPEVIAAAPIRDRHERN